MAQREFHSIQIEIFLLITRASRNQPINDRPDSLNTHMSMSHMQSTLTRQLLNPLKIIHQPCILPEYHPWSDERCLP